MVVAHIDKAILLSYNCTHIECYVCAALEGGVRHAHYCDSQRVSVKGLLNTGYFYSNTNYVHTCARKLSAGS